MPADVKSASPILDENTVETQPREAVQFSIRDDLNLRLAHVLRYSWLCASRTCQVHRTVRFPVLQPRFGGRRNKCTSERFIDPSSYRETHFHVFRHALEVFVCRQ